MTVDEAQDRIIEEMERLEGRMEKYEYLVDLAGELEPLAEESRTEDNLVGGCQSSVWLDARLEDGVMRIEAWSDAKIVSGIIALILRVLDGRTPGEIASTDLYFLDRTGLSSSLSPARAGGMKAIVERIRSLAENPRI